MDIVGQRALKKKVCDISYPSTYSMCPPPVKYKPKRGVKKSRKREKSDVHRDPSQWEYAEASQGSQTTKRSCTQQNGSQLSTMPIGKQPSINSAKAKYLSQFPAFYHPYIDDIFDVELDRNCGFCCISFALGWGEDACYDVQRQLHTQIQKHADLFSKLFYDTVFDVSNSLLVKHLGLQGKEKWMTIPDMGYPIASKYSVVVFVSLSMLMNIIFFPFLITPPSYTSRHTIIAVGFVNRNHWIQIKLRPDCPLPPITDRWRHNYSNNA
ncbi:uncharacterized protein LOC131649894 [Vicia villosa]|uniref:uncharacterized protein LOC131649894 n=1 Tax=Vicia villosa TaxID=3911 RepID=UPI00273C8870|nr:uncharacterized protein LOC131649894 [Vicia villosa]